MRRRDFLRGLFAAPVAAVALSTLHSTQPESRKRSPWGPQGEVLEEIMARPSRLFKIQPDGAER